jgi:hypothetical protein
LHSLLLTIAALVADRDSAIATARACIVAARADMNAVRVDRDAAKAAISEFQSNQHVLVMESCDISFICGGHISQN